MNPSPVTKYIFMLLLCLPSLWLKANAPISAPILLPNAIIDTTVCEGDCVIFDNTAFCAEGTYQLLNNRTLKLNLAPLVQQTSLTICEGETFPGQDWSSSGRYNYQTNLGACDITVWVDLRIEQPKETFINQVIKYGECYDFGPNTLCQTGEYELRYSTIHGCDSTVYINLTVEELLVDTLASVSVCPGDTYSPSGIDTVLTNSGLYQFYSIDADGRTLLTILDFRVESDVITYLEKMVCEGNSFIHDGQSYNQEGVYELNYTAADGCDSTVFLDLTVNPVKTTRFIESIMPGAFMTIGNNAVNIEGSYEFVFQSAMGCDSIVQLELTIDGNADNVMITDVDIVDEICSGNLKRNLCVKDLPFSLGQNTFYQGGVFDLTYVPPNGCVTDIRLELTVDLSTEFLTEQICEGDNYAVNTSEYTQTGIYRDTLFSAASNGCDSIIILDLTVMPIKDTIVAKNICWGEPFIINGQFVTESGEYTQMFQTKFGCDSLVTTMLTIEGSPIPEMQQLALCAGESYADDFGNKVFVSGLYNFRFTNESGCDSVVTLDLLIPDTIRQSVDTFFCDGEAFEFQNFSVTLPGNYRERFTSALGCDSLVRYTLTALDCEINSVQDADTIICGGNTGEFSFMLIKGQAPFSYQWTSENGAWSGDGADLGLREEVVVEGLPSGEYSIVVTDRNGKEAILEVIIFRPEIITAEWILPPLQGDVHLACSEDSGAFLEITPAGGLPPYRYEWSTGMINTNRIEDLSAGTYTITITDDFNCPFVVNEQITAPLPLVVDAIGENPTCEDLASGQINTLSTTGGTAPYQYELEGVTNTSIQSNFQNLTGGTYRLNAIDANGCQTDTTLQIITPEILSLDYDRNISIDLGETYDLEVFSSGIPQTIEWETAEGLSCEDCLNVGLNPIDNSIYTLTVTSKDDCVTTINLNVSVSKERKVFIPNVFSPNLDGLNDQFTVFGNQGVSNVDYLQVYSRWGELIFETYDMVLNDERKGWNGYHLGKKMKPGVYIWQAKVTFIDGESLMYTGDVTLLE